MELNREFTPEENELRRNDISLIRAYGDRRAMEGETLDTLAHLSQDTDFIDALQKASPSLSHEEAQLAFLAGVGDLHLGSMAQIGNALQRHDEAQNIVDGWAVTRAAERRPEDYKALQDIIAATRELQMYGNDIELVREVANAKHAIDGEIGISRARSDRAADFALAEKSYWAGRQYAALREEEQQRLPFSKPVEVYRREDFERGQADYQKEHGLKPEFASELGGVEKEILKAAIARAREIEHGVRIDPAWLQQERDTIIQQAQHQPAPEFEAQHDSYVSGSRAVFNSILQDIAQANPGRKDLPAAIRIDEIRVREQTIEREQTQETALHLSL